MQIEPMAHALYFLIYPSGLSLVHSGAAEQDIRIMIPIAHLKSKGGKGGLSEEGMVTLRARQ